MEHFQWYHFAWIIFLGFMIWRMVPVAKNWIKNGPRGSSSEWLNAGLILLGVGLFVMFLISIVRN